jgi:hypothetical protein
LSFDSRAQPGVARPIRNSISPADESRVAASRANKLQKLKSQSSQRHRKVRQDGLSLCDLCATLAIFAVKSFKRESPPPVSRRLQVEIKLQILNRKVRKSIAKFAKTGVRFATFARSLRSLRLKALNAKPSNGFTETSVGSKNFPFRKQRLELQQTIVFRTPDKLLL